MIQTSLLSQDQPTCTEDIVHYYCCDPHRAWCGADISGERECPDDCGCQPCVVCDDDDMAEPCACTP